MRRIIPYPLLFVVLLIIWLLLNGFSAGQLVLGLIVSFIATRATGAMELPPVVIHSWSAVFTLAGRVIVDLVASNLAAIRLILSSRPTRRSGFVAMPLELRDRTGLAVLALIINFSPGTAWLEYDSGSGTALLHVLDFASEDMTMDLIRNRYEGPLREIFE